MGSVDRSCSPTKETSFGEYVKIVVPLTQDADGYPPISSESLWAEPTESCVGYSVANIPFFAPVLSCGAIVRAVPDEQGGLVFDGVIAGGGHSTVRIIFFDENSVESFKNSMKRFGCDYEVGHKETFLSVDVPPNVPYADVADI
ncbi:DUF4265 domain-containing protein [Actinopolyspora halophila]|uniref:DUF4265 domain-containing protein n=1 Tax=Actinopolyspora halophila TaxID=1850 RepID=UPI0009FD2D99